MSRFIEVTGKAFKGEIKFLLNINNIFEVYPIFDVFFKTRLVVNDNNILVFEDYETIKKMILEA
jgi:hypothetical protein